MHTGLCTLNICVPHGQSRMPVTNFAEEVNPSSVKLPLIIQWRYSSWWHHQIGSFSASLALCAGNSHKGQWRGALMLSLVCVWINGWVNNRDAGDLRRYRAHYDVIVMLTQINLLSNIGREIITDVESLKTKFNIWTHLASIKIKYPVYCYKRIKLSDIGMNDTSGCYFTHASSPTHACEV